MITYFNKIFDTMKHNNLIKGLNLLRYNYYIIRIASKNGKTKGYFDDRLFGQVYKILGWNIDFKCPYYLE